MNDHIKRSITGIIFAFLLLFATWWSQWSFMILFLLIATLSLWEFYKLVGTINVAPQKIAGIIIGISLYTSSFLFFFNKQNLFYLILSSSLFYIIFIFELFRKTETPFTNIAYTLLGIFYIIVPFSMLAYIGFSTGSDFQWKLVIGYFLLIWANDTAAYFIGVKFGEHKLFERISPNKSWEGFLSGMVMCFIATYVISHYYVTLSFFSWIVMALIVVVAGTFGDLVESLFKRSINYKDSGKLLPGHGGVLDRFDSMLLSAPFIGIYLFIIGN